jgi:hypothetical protein
MPKRLTQEEFIARANIEHNNKYGYLKFVYGGFEVKGTITCPKHGDFEQRPHNHFGGKNNVGQGCPKCGRSFSLEEFIAKARLIHGDKYSYLKSIYVRIDKKLTITCDIHGDFQQKPAGHLSGRGCKLCGFLIQAKSNKSFEKFIKKARLKHGDRYSYLKFIYGGYQVRGLITCKIHGDFEQTPLHHLDGHGCFDCSVDASRLTFEEFKSRSIKFHNGFYNYDCAADVFIDSTTPVPINCPKHKIFYQRPSQHMVRTGCPICNVAGSSEELIFLMLMENNIKFEYDYFIKKIDKSEKQKYYLDFFFPDINIVIEYNGLQHYKASKFGEKITDEEANQKLLNQQDRDRYVEKFCQSHNIDIIWIDGRKYFGPYLRRYIVSLLLSLGLITLTQATQKYNWYKL